MEDDKDRYFRRGTLSFSGCGFLCIYHVGVASCFRQYASHLLKNEIAGASGGSLSACALICDVPLGETTTEILKIAIEARSRYLGPFHPSFDLNNILYTGLVKLLPQDAHIRCNGRLRISVTRVPDGQNIILSEFNSRDELIQALLCSCFIPFYSGVVPPKFCGVSYIDGGFTNNQPILDENTITISPFSGESDICPDDLSFNVMQFSFSNTSVAISPDNLYRIVRTIYPPDPEVLSKVCQQGFDDALKFLQRNSIISCTKCLQVQSTFRIGENKTQIQTKDTTTRFIEDTSEHVYDDCMDCKLRRKNALLDHLPESVAKAIQDACEQMNDDIIDWLFTHQPIKTLSLVALPYILPISITIVICLKIWEILPILLEEMKSFIIRSADLAKRELLNKFTKQTQSMSAQLSCQFAITEFDYANEERVTIEAISEVDSVARTHEFISKEFGKQSLRKQRMSYAGHCSVPPQQPTRRRSSIETTVPERVIKNMKFDFTIDLAETEGIIERKKRKLVDAFKSLKNNTETNIANKVLEWEKDYIEFMDPQNANSLEHVLEVTTTKDAVMAFHYEDKENVKVTEIFNIFEESENVHATEVVQKNGDIPKTTKNDLERTYSLNLNSNLQQQRTRKKAVIQPPSFNLVDQ